MPRQSGRVRSTIFAVTLGTCTVAATVCAARVAVSEKAGHTSEAMINVDAPPDEVYRVATEYAQWPSVLSDVTAVTIERGGRRDARVKFRSKALGSMVTIQLDNQPGHAIRFRGVDGPSGSSAYGEYRFDPIAGGRTRITATFMLHAGGLSGLFVSGSKVARMRRAKIESDLADLARRFAH